MPLNVKCMNCGSAHLAPRIGVACRVCGKRMLLPVEEAEARLAVATAASEDAKKIRYETAQERWAALPAESRKLRAFISAEFKSEDRFAAYLRNIGHKCSRSMAQKILRTGQAKHSTARAIAIMMQRRGYEPSILHPDVFVRVSDHKRMAKRRRDYHQWMRTKRAREQEGEK